MLRQLAYRLLAALATAAGTSTPAGVLVRVAALAGPVDIPDEHGSADLHRYATSVQVTARSFRVPDPSQTRHPIDLHRSWAVGRMLASHPQRRTRMRSLSRRLARRVMSAVAVVAVGGGAGATPALANESTPQTPSGALHPDLYRTDEVGALARLKLGNSGRAEALSAETFADIDCSRFPLRRVIEKGWGVDYPRTTRLHVIRDLFIDGRWWKTLERRPTTTSTGAWSTPTTDHTTFLGGDHMLWVTAYYDGGARIGRATDVCDF